MNFHGITTILLVLLCSPLRAMVTVEAALPWTDLEGWSPLVVTVSSDRETTLVFTAYDEGPLARGERRIPVGLTRFTLPLPSNDQNLFWVRFDWYTPDQQGEHSARKGLDHRDRYLAYLGDGSGSDALEKAGFTDRHALTAEQLPDLWQCYPQWLVMIIQAKHFRALTSAQQQALRESALVQQNIFIVDGAIEGLPSLEGEKFQSTQGDHPTLKVLLNQARSVPGINLSTLPKSSSNSGTLLAVLALLYALIAGPGALFFSRRKRSPLLLFVAVPISALATTGLLILLGLLADGTATRYRHYQILELGAADQRSVLWTTSDCYAPFTGPSQTLEPGERLLAVTSRTYGDSSRYGVEHLGLSLREENGVRTASGDWLPGRLSRRLERVQVLPTRQRLVLRQEGDTLTLGNGLAMELRNIYYLDADHAWYHAAQVASGETVRLQRLPRFTPEPWNNPVPPSAASRVGEMAPGTLRARASQLFRSPPISGTELAPPELLVIAHVTAEAQP